LPIKIAMIEEGQSSDQFHPADAPHIQQSPPQEELRNRIAPALLI